MVLELKHIKYVCQNKQRLFSFSAEVLITYKGRDSSGRGESVLNSNDAVQKAVINALRPLDIINMAEVLDLRILPNEPTEVFIVGFLGGKELVGCSKNPDRPIAIAEALVDLHVRFLFLAQS